jgi:hypothetical protein
MVPAPAEAPGAPSGYLILVPDQLEPIAEIAAPWAVDANGKAVPVRYTVDHDTVVMHADHDDAAYPIVADPTVRLGWNGYNVIFTRRDVDAVLRNFEHVRGAGAVCAFIPNTPARAACIVASNSYLTYIKSKFMDADRANSCLNMLLRHAPAGSVVIDSRYRC